MGWVRPAARLVEMKNGYKIFVGETEGTSCFRDIYVDGRIILKLILNKQGVRARTIFIWLRIGTSGGFL
jgi:hypothetical protein